MDKDYTAIDELLYTLLLDYGFAVSQKGFKFIGFAVNYIVDNDMSVKKLYQTIAKAYDTTYKNVERQIHHALDCTAVFKGIKNYDALTEIAYRYYYKRQSAGMTRGAATDDGNEM